MSKEVEETINYFEDREISMKVDVDTDKLLKALGVTEEDSFDKQVYRMETLINRIKELEEKIKLCEDTGTKIINKKTFTDNFINKQVIRNKIEELRKHLKDVDYHDIEDSEERKFYKKEYMQTLMQIQVLNELLEEE